MTNAKLIFTPSNMKAQKGIFDNGEYTLRVEVNKVQGSACFTFYINGKADHGVTRVSAEESWQDLSEMLGANFVELNKSEISKRYDDYKSWMKELTTQRKKVKVQKEKQEQVIGLFSGKPIDFGE